MQNCELSTGVQTVCAHEHVYLSTLYLNDENLLPSSVTLLVSRVSCLSDNQTHLTEMRKQLCTLDMERLSLLKSQEMLQAELDISLRDYVPSAKIDEGATWVKASFCMCCRPPASAVSFVGTFPSEVLTGYSRKGCSLCELYP